MKKILLLITAWLISACSFSSNEALKDADFVALMNNNVEKIMKNPNYRRIPIETQKQEDEFLKLYYQAYKKEMTKTEFIEAMTAKYPNYSESIQWNAEQLPD